MVVYEIDRVAIAQIVFYVPAFFFALFISQKHGWAKHAGWVFLALFALVRIVGSSLQLAADNNPSRGLYVGAFICQSIGLSPLLLTLLGLLKRVHMGMFKSILPFQLLNAQYILLFVGFILAIVGGSKSQDSDSIDTARALTETAVTIFMISLVAMICFAILLFTERREVPEGEIRLLYAALAAAPFLFIRLIYSMVAAWDHNSTKFNLLTGKIVIRVFMATLEEFLVVTIFLTAGFLTPALPRNNIRQEDPPHHHEPQELEAGRIGGSGGQRGPPRQQRRQQRHQRRRRRQGPIMTLVNMARDYYGDKKMQKQDQTSGVVAYSNEMDVDGPPMHSQAHGVQHTGVAEAP